MDGVRSPDPLLVVRIAAVRREFLLIGTVQIGKGPCYHIAIPELSLFEERLEQPPPHNLKPLFCACRSPRGLHASNHVPKPVQCFAPTLTANLHIIRQCMWRSRRIRCRQADHQHAVIHILRRLGERLGKGKLRLEVPRWQVALVVELAGIRHPLVDQDQAWSVLFEQFAQRIAGIRGLLVVCGNARIGLLGLLQPTLSIAQLPGHFAPQRANYRPICLLRGVAGGNLVAHQHYAPD